MNEPLVSIACITYNHEKYIAQAIEGFLLQKTSFPIEIIIHDDASTDNTKKIVEQYAKINPNLIFPIYQQVNQYSLGNKPFIKYVLPHCRGKYIALCEGDDYWTDPNKLQRQADYLEEHPEYILVAENSIWHNLFNDTKRKFSELPERDIHILELLRKRQFGTASVLFRNLGNKLYTGDVFGDTILWCHLTKLGKIRYMENVSSIYRRHSGGVTEGDKIQWAKKMVVWNNALSQNHPEINGLVFKKRNLGNFKDAINYLIKNKLYKQTLLAIDELINFTADPLEYKEELFRYIEELLLQKDKQLFQVYNSWSFEIGRAVTMPVRVVLRLKNKVLRSIYRILPETVRNKRKLKKRGVIFIDKRKIIKDSKNLKPLPSPSDRHTPKLIVSLTSFPERIPEIFFNLYSLLNQTIQPDMLILWLAEEQFPNKEKDLSERVMGLQKYGLSIRWCKDIKSYKKLILSLKEYPNDIIVTADDDIYYPENWLEVLYNSYLRETQHIHCYRAHRITFNDKGEIGSYNTWPKCISTKDVSYANFFTGCGGVLYPPGSLHKDILNEELFMKLCPTADDIWFWAMAVLNNTKIRVVDNNLTEIYIIPEVEFGLKDGIKLYKVNIHANDGQLKNVIDFYKQNLMDIINEKQENGLQTSNLPIKH